MFSFTYLLYKVAENHQITHISAKPLELSIWSTAAFQSQTSPVVSDYVPHVVVCWPYHVIDVAHSAVRHSQSPDPLSGTCFQTNSETPTVLSLHSDSHWRHSSLTSI